MVSFSSCCKIDNIPVLLLYTRFEDERSVIMHVSLCLYCKGLSHQTKAGAKAKKIKEQAKKIKE